MGDILKKVEQNFCLLTFAISLIIVSIIGILVILFFILNGVLPNPVLLLIYWFVAMIIYQIGGIFLAKFQEYDAQKQIDNSFISGMFVSEKSGIKRNLLHFLNYFIDIFAYVKSFGEIIAFYSQGYFFYHIRKGWSLANHQSNIDIKKSHVGIIVNQYHTHFGKEYCYGFGVDLLIESFQNNIPYFVYPCNTKENFFEIISNPNVTSVWIFGHGNHGTILCGDGLLKYQDLFDQLPKGFRPKNAIYQMHCNDGKQISLVELLSNSIGFVNSTKNTMFGLRYYTKLNLEKNFDDIL
mgnify:CR=1 FL=1